MHFFFSGPRLFWGLVRPGIVLEPRDFRRSVPTGSVEGSFIYAIEAVSGNGPLVKIGITTNPRARLAALGTASPYPLRLRYLAATPGDGTNIEQEAHSLLGRYRGNGEWFHYGHSGAIVAIELAALALQEPLLCVTLERADAILALARTLPAGSRPRPDTPIAVLKTILAILALIALVGILTA